MTNKFRIFNTAENIAKNFTISRVEQDNYAAKSQQKAQVAITAGYFNKEIIPVTVTNRKQSVIISSDEFPKADTTIEALGKLRPVFLKVNKHINLYINFFFSFYR